MPIDRLRLEMPFPPPLSACFKDVQFKNKTTGQTFRTRAPTGRYTTWQKEAAKAIDVQTKHLPKNEGILMSGKVAVTVRLVAPDRRGRDADNCGKALLDALVKNKMIEDDSNLFVRDLKFSWRDDGLPCVIFILPVGDVT